MLVGLPGVLLFCVVAADVVFMPCLTLGSVRWMSDAPEGLLVPVGICWQLSCALCVTVLAEHDCMSLKTASCQSGSAVM